MFMSNDYSNPNTNPRTLTMLTPTEPTITHDVYKEILYAIRSLRKS